MTPWSLGASRIKFVIDYIRCRILILFKVALYFYCSLQFSEVVYVSRIFKLKSLPLKCQRFLHEIAEVV